MTPLDLTALAAALPPETPLALSGSQLFIGTSFQCNDDAGAFPQTVEAEVNGATTQIQNWPAGVTSAEQMLAFTYFESMLQQQLGDGYAAAAAAGTLPTWTPGAALPE